MMPKSKLSSHDGLYAFDCNNNRQSYETNLSEVTAKLNVKFSFILVLKVLGFNTHNLDHKLSI